MIIENATIRFILKTNIGEFSGTEYPKNPDKYYSEAIQAQAKVNSYSNKGVSNGNTFTIAQYDILIEERELQSEEIELSIENKLIGEFSIISFEKLSPLLLIRILV